MPVFELTYSDAYVIEAWQRNRRWSASRYFTPSKVVLGICLASLVAFALTHHLYGSGGTLSFILVLLIVSRRFDEWLIRGRIRKSPVYNTLYRFELSATGVAVTCINANGQMSWDAFTGARRFDDGFLLRQWPKRTSWLPVKAMIAGSVDEVDKILRAHIVNYKFMP